MHIVLQWPHSCCPPFLHPPPPCSLPSPPLQPRLPRKKRRGKPEITNVLWRTISGSPRIVKHAHRRYRRTIPRLNNTYPTAPSIRTCNGSLSRKQEIRHNYTIFVRATDSHNPVNTRTSSDYTQQSRLCSVPSTLSPPSSRSLFLPSPRPRRKFSLSVNTKHTHTPSLISKKCPTILLKTINLTEYTSGQSVG